MDLADGGQRSLSRLCLAAESLPAQYGVGNLRSVAAAPGKSQNVDIATGYQRRSRCRSQPEGTGLVPQNSILQTVIAQAAVQAQEFVRKCARQKGKEIAYRPERDIGRAGCDALDVPELRDPEPDPAGLAVYVMAQVGDAANPDAGAGQCLATRQSWDLAGQSRVESGSAGADSNANSTSPMDVARPEYAFDFHVPEARAAGKEIGDGDLSGTRLEHAWQD